jgi:transcriptional regulator with XRE-family HTH domain
MLTAEHLRAARALVKMSQADLAESAGVSVGTVKRWEGGDGPLKGSAASVGAAQRALEAAGVIFIYGNRPGVQLKGQEGK